MLTRSAKKLQTAKKSDSSPNGQGSALNDQSSKKRRTHAYVYPTKWERAGLPFGAQRRELPPSVFSYLLRFLFLNDLGASLFFVNHALAASTVRFLQNARELTCELGGLLPGASPEERYAFALAIKHCSVLQSLRCLSSDENDDFHSPVYKGVTASRKWLQALVKNNRKSLKAVTSPFGFSKQTLGHFARCRNLEGLDLSHAAYGPRGITMKHVKLLTPEALPALNTLRLEAKPGLPDDNTYAVCHDACSFVFQHELARRGAQAAGSGSAVGFAAIHFCGFSVEPHGPVAMAMLNGDGGEAPQPAVLAAERSRHRFFVGSVGS